MTSRDFCYWLQGYFEISTAEAGEPNDILLNPDAVKKIRTHLALVFYHEIDPSYSSKPEEQAKMNKIHSGFHDGLPAHLRQTDDNNGIVMRC